MNRAEIVFDFLSPWHMGSGHAEGAYSDAVPVRTQAGLPYVPGRTVKGLFREAVTTLEECGQADPGTTTRLFGTRTTNDSRYETTPGELRFTSATLGDEMERWSEGRPAERRELYTTLSSTRIDGDGLAWDQTLRKVEAAIPVRVIGSVEAKNAVDVELLKKAATLIRQAGAHRHRGLGRVKVEIQKAGEVSR